MTAGPPPDTGIDAAILDRMTDTLIILQAKSATTDRSKMIAALQALRGRHPDAQVILVEGESDARVIRECLQSIERTSLGTPGARQTRAKATAERVADILLRHQELPESTSDQPVISLQAVPSASMPDDLAAAGVVSSASPTSTTDTALLVQRAANGDRQAWERLVDRYARLIWSITVEFKLTESDAADVAQATWLRLLERIDRIEYPDRLGSWLAATARNECLRSLTTHKRPVRAQDKEEALFGMATSGPIGERLLAGERDQAVRDTLSRLPRRWQRLLELLMADPPASYAEISDELGLPLGTIGPTRGRALARLRELLQVSEADTDSQMNPCTPDDGEAHQDWTTAGELVHAQCG